MEAKSLDEPNKVIMPESQQIFTAKPLQNKY